MILQSKITSGEVEEISSNIVDVEKRLNQAQIFLNYARKDSHDSQNNEPRYSNAYDATRMGCEAILLFFGYRVKKSIPGRHRIVISVAKELLAGKLINEFKRLGKARGKRNGFEYGIAIPISDAEVAQLIADSEKLLQESFGLVHSKKQSLGI